MRYTAALFCLLLTWSLIACGQVDAPPATESVPAPVDNEVVSATAVPQQPAASPTTTLEIDDADDELAETHAETIEFGRSLLAQWLGVDADALTVTDVTTAEWPDGCLGLSQPTEACTEAVVPGLRIRLTIGDQIYEVRTDMAGGEYRWAALQ
jgi:hypothetical protein